MIDPTTRRRVLALIGLAALVLICIPRTIFTVPAYGVIVIDDHGKPLSNLPVSQMREDFSLGGSDGIVNAQTDSYGRASFESHTRRASIGGEVISCVGQILKTGAHASCGSYYDISASSSNLIEIARNDERLSDKPHHNSLRLTLKSCPSGDWRQCETTNSNMPPSHVTH